MTDLFELKISFSESENKLHTKRAVKGILDAAGFSYVEEVIDGVETALDSINEDETIRALPMAVYDEAEAKLEGLLFDLKSKFDRLLSFEIQKIEGQAWSQSWQDESLTIESNQFCIVKNTENQNPSKTNIFLNQGEAFGDGRHATTEACLHVFEDIDTRNLQSLLDVGTGTGIFLIVGGKLGIPNLQGTEVAQELVTEAESNLERNSTNATVTLTDDLYHIAPQSQDLVIANILIPVLIDLKKDIVNTLNRDGYLILSGFIEKEAKVIREHYLQLGLEELKEYDVRGWKALLFKKQ